MITGADIVKAALSSDLIGTPYSKLDCQATVEKVLQLAGMKIPNYRGSNHMWRELVYDRQPIVNQNLKPGCLVFIVKYDGGEKKRGYNDNAGNDAHVAIFIGDGKVFESTTGGVQISKVTRFTHSGLIKDVDYDSDGKGSTDNAGERATAGADLRKTMFADLDNIRRAVNGISTHLDNIADYLERLEELINEVQ